MSAHVSHTACAASVLGARPRLSLSRLRRGGSGRVPPTKAPLTKDPTAFLGGYLEDPIDEIKRQFAKIKRQFEREGCEKAKEEL